MPDTYPTGVSPKREIPPYVPPSGGGGGGSGDPLFATFTAGAAVEIGEVVYFASSGVVLPAQGNAVATSLVLGVVKVGGGVGDTVEVYLFGVCSVLFDPDDPPPELANGSRCWLSQANAGWATVAPNPPGSNSSLAPLGIVLGADGSTALVPILLRIGEPAFGA
jgi:hypothetical protein